MRDVEEVISAVKKLGGLVSVLDGAEAKERAELYAALGVEITSSPTLEPPSWQWSHRRWVKRVPEGGLAA